VDTAVLKTLAKEEFRAGFAEVIKYGIIWDGNLFIYLESNLEHIFNLQAEHLRETIKRCCAIKAKVVEEDEREAGVRAILNFGHTVGHAIESLTNYVKYKHGEAVAIGMIAANNIAVKIGMFDESQARRIEELIIKSGLPHKIVGLETENIIDKLKKDKKVKDSKVRFVLPKTIGEVVIRDDIGRQVLSQVIDEMRE
jgi:3-dehydroquinate synthase